ncbi:MULTISPECIES: acyl-CoA dehydrogenase family protein [Rhodococcus]|uniref:Acyl-CoA dehydrogenase family protein n=1 Tax=Rhodococcus oxybenzonivorans TaxID=1990687 RepID=A0AAE4V4W0_9NOCA|nr:MULTISPECIES: acyl-CoA dehydrogenase family protein [Rhodococcus]MDV7245394.1 acyl-CoA dehydrogenase family protein [Rhodococcus oxybenzonivorans]MDV7268886.1 acyl-CoA dehydrogenase family protein [Rhodococcus oxybenzonivorans]MDV7276474.1 acyl-CoA dehydrogenase family protein [Rhodococcus oxybenzonivorans]MDV7336599.1 acyl-CoA dehydrogenase family protein [Rhodococcus oxybenzonivorans]MDV7346930.1 acyl-CoA dehydrogenase family protein [Rhodococcus oxybenzonivorans]
MSNWAEMAREIAENVLFPVADSVDADGEIPDSHFETLAADGFYGLAAPDDESVTPSVLVDVLETLCGGCLATAFTWMQHHGVVAGLAASPNTTLQGRYLDGLVDGTVRAGVALAGAIPVPPTLWARRVEDGYVLDGVAPFVTGWGIVDLLQVSARDEFDDTIVHVIIPAQPLRGLSAADLPLIAARGSNTVRLTFDGLAVPGELVSAVVSPDEFAKSQLFGSWINGCMAMGITRRAISELETLGVDSDPFEEQAARARLDLNAALEGRADIADARARASELAVRTASALVTAKGSSALIAGNTAERLVREATFTLVAAGRPAIKAALLDRLSRD